MSTLSYCTVLLSATPTAGHCLERQEALEQQQAGARGVGSVIGQRHKFLLSPISPSPHPFFFPFLNCLVSTVGQTPRLYG